MAADDATSATITRRRGDRKEKERVKLQKHSHPPSDDVDDGPFFFFAVAAPAVLFLPAKNY